MYYIYVLKNKIILKQNNINSFDFLFVLIINFREDVVMGSGGRDFGRFYLVFVGVAVEILIGVYGAIYFIENVSIGLYIFWIVIYL